MSFKKHEVMFDASSMYCENYVVLKNFGGNQKMLNCGCGTIFFSNHYDKIIQCPTCKAENTVLESIEMLAKHAMDHGMEKDLEPVIMRMAECIGSFDLHSEDEFPNLSKYWDKI